MCVYQVIFTKQHFFFSLKTLHLAGFEPSIVYIPAAPGFGERRRIGGPGGPSRAPKFKPNFDRPGSAGPGCDISIFFVCSIELTFFYFLCDIDFLCL
jgi:hypothetical protein